jgi:ABC-2 type transport system permease protein
MLRGLWKLTWIEIKIFLREPLGRDRDDRYPGFSVPRGGPNGRPQSCTPTSPAASSFIGVGLPVLASVLILISAVLSLVTIISIYREGGILKRLRATPLRPQTILTAHVLVKLLLTAATLVLMVAAGKRYYPSAFMPRWLGFTMALLISTCSILSIGFLIASIVPTARFAQPIGAVIMYPMMAVSGLFAPVESLPPAASSGGQSFAAHLRGVTARRDLEGRRMVGARARPERHWPLVFIVCTALSAKVFRWE